MDAPGAAGRRRALFTKELRCMLFGYGDDANPYTETVDFLEDLVIEFIQVGNRILTSSSPRFPKV